MTYTHRLPLARGSHCQLPVRSVHRIPGLEGYNLSPCQFLEMGTEFRWGVYPEYKRLYPDK